MKRCSDKHVSQPHWVMLARILLAAPFCAPSKAPQCSSEALILLWGYSNLGFWSNSERLAQIIRDVYCWKEQRHSRNRAPNLPNPHPQFYTVLLTRLLGMPPPKLLHLASALDDDHSVLTSRLHTTEQARVQRRFDAPRLEEDRTAVGRHVQNQAP